MPWLPTSAENTILQREIGTKVPYLLVRKSELIILKNRIGNIILLYYADNNTYMKSRFII